MLLYPASIARAHTLGSALLFTTWIGCIIAQVGDNQEHVPYIGWAGYVLFALHLAYIRGVARKA